MPVNPWESYYAEFVRLNDFDIRNQPLHFLYGGYIFSGSIGFAGHDGYYYSSTVANVDSAYRMHFSANVLYPSINVNRSYGFSVRCLAR